MAARARAELLVLVGLPALALAVAPGLEAPFSTPKRFVLCALALAAVGLALLDRRDGSAAPEAALVPALAIAGLSAGSALSGGSAGVDALTLLLAACALFLALAKLGPRPVALVRALAWTSSALAALAVAQALGADPFRALGWRPLLGGSRMDVYASLGNPDFLAAILVPSACATAARLRGSATGGWRTRAAWAGALALQAAALALTRSFATVLALLAALAVVALGGGGLPRSRRRWALGLGAALLAAAALGTAGRALPTLARGRLYLFKVAAPHLLDAPWLGHGPGSVAARWPAWEASYWETRGPPEERGFVAAQTHAHDDWLEVGLDLGLPGLVALLAWVALALAAGLRRAGGDPDALALTCALAALAARALVDFPLQRPAGLGLFALLTATLVSRPVPSLSPAVLQEPACAASSAPSPSPSA